MKGEKRKEAGLSFSSPDPKKRKTATTPQTPIKSSVSKEHSSDSDTPGIADCKVEDIVLSVREMDDNTLRIIISNSRPETRFGKKQADHVTAFTNFIQMLAEIAENQSIKKVAPYFFDVAKAVIPDKIEPFNVLLNKYKEKTDRYYSREERKNLTAKQKEQDIDQQETERLKTSLKAAERSLFKSIIEEMGETFLKQLNLGETIVFKKVIGSETDKGESATVKKAIHGLKLLNDLEKINKEQNSKNTNFNDMLDFFYNDYLKVGAKYKDGANAVIGESNVKKCINILEKKGKEKKDVILGMVYEAASQDKKKKIAGFFGGLFDYKYANHKTDKLDTLYEVTARHLVIMFHAFSEFKEYDSKKKNEIIDLFLQEDILDIQHGQGWSSVKSLNLDSFKDEMKKYLKLEGKEIRMRSREELKEWVKEEEKKKNSSQQKERS